MSSGSRYLGTEEVLFGFSVIAVPVYASLEPQRHFWVILGINLPEGITKGATFILSISKFRHRNHNAAAYESDQFIPLSDGQYVVPALQ